MKCYGREFIVHWIFVGDTKHVPTAKYLLMCFLRNTFGIIYETQNRTGHPGPYPALKLRLKCHQQGLRFVRAFKSPSGVRPPPNPNPLAHKVFSDLLLLSRNSQSLPPFYLIVHHDDFGVRFVTLDNTAGRRDSLGITEFSR